MSKKLSQAILPLAGLGTRFLPWTKSVPKEMLPLGTKPFVAHLVEECVGMGITDLCFVISEGKELIPQYFERDEKLETEMQRRGNSTIIEELHRYDAVRFHVVYQHEQRGDGHAILQAKDWVASDEIAILFGDDLFIGAGSALEQLKKGYDVSEGAGERAVIALENIPREQTKKYGIVEVESEDPSNPRLKKLKSLVEKPDPAVAPSTLGIVGRYLIPRSTFAVLPRVHSATRDGEIRLIDALIAQLKDIAIFGYECEGKRLDTGTPEGYRNALIAFEAAKSQVH